MRCVWGWCGQMEELKGKCEGIVGRLLGDGDALDKALHLADLHGTAGDSESVIFY